jgi:hypothetical protein
VMSSHDAAMLDLKDQVRQGVIGGSVWGGLEGQDVTQLEHVFCRMPSDALSCLGLCLPDALVIFVLFRLTVALRRPPQMS